MPKSWWMTKATDFLLLPMMKRNGQGQLLRQKDVIDLKAYNLYVAYKRTEGFDGYPVTLPPYDDGNFSTKSWPNGYKDIDPFESYRSVFNGELSTVENPELIFTRGNNQGSYGVNYMGLLSTSGQ